MIYGPTYRFRLAATYRARAGPVVQNPASLVLRNNEAGCFVPVRVGLGARSDRGQQVCEGQPDEKGCAGADGGDVFVAEGGLKNLSEIIICCIYNNTARR